MATSQSITDRFGPEDPDVWGAWYRIEVYLNGYQYDVRQSSFI